MRIRLREWRRQRGTVDLAVRGEGEFVDPDQVARHHEVRQCCVKMCAQGWHVDHIGTICSGIMRDQHTLVFRGCRFSGVPCLNNRARDTGKPMKCDLNLSGFDPEAPYLQLVVHAAEKLDGAITPPAGQITSAIKTVPTGFFRAVIFGKRMGDKTLGREGGIVPVAKGKTVAPDIKLSCHAGRQKPQFLVKDIGRRIGNWRADGNSSPIVTRLDPETAGKGCILGWTVAIDQGAVRKRFNSFHDMGNGQRLAAHKQLSERLQTLRIFIDHHIEQPAGEPECCDILAHDRVAKIGETLFSAWCQGKPGAVQKRSPDFESGGVERDWGILQEDLIGTEIGVVRPPDKPDNTALRHGDRFRSAR